MGFPSASRFDLPSPVSAIVTRDDRWHLLAVIVVGVALGVTHLDLATDDTYYYWLTGQAIGDGTYFLIDMPPRYTDLGFRDVLLRLPVYPVLTWLSSLVFGSWVFVNFLPVVVAAVLFPLPMYFTLRSVGVESTRALFATLLLLVFPPFQLTTLSTALPDALFVFFLVTALYYAIQLCDEVTTKRQVLFGLLGGLALLTRPEAVLYVPTMFLVVVLSRRVIPFVASAIFSCFGLLWVLVSYVTLGDFWYSSRNSWAYQLENVARNVSMFVEGYESYVSLVSIWVPAAILFLLLAGGLLVLGTRAISSDRWPLLVLWVPIAVHFGVHLLLHPQLTYAHVPHSFFRHVSYSFPFLLLFGALGWESLGSFTRPIWERVVRYALQAQAFVWIGMLVTPAAVKHKPTMTSLPVLLGNPVSMLVPSTYERLYGFRSQLPEEAAFIPWRDAMREFYSSQSLVTNSLALVVVSIVLLAIVVQWTFRPIAPE